MQEHLGMASPSQYVLNPEDHGSTLVSGVKIYNLWSKTYQCGDEMKT